MDLGYSSIPGTCEIAEDGRKGIVHKKSQCECGGKLAHTKYNISLETAQYSAI